MLSRNNNNNNITHERPQNTSHHHLISQPHTTISLLILTYFRLQRHPVTCKPQVHSHLNTLHQDRRDRVSTGQRADWNPQPSQRDPVHNSYRHGTSAEERPNNMRTSATGPQHRSTATMDGAVISNLASVPEEAGSGTRSLSNVTTGSVLM
jgi:hypothetical protein